MFGLETQRNGDNIPNIGLGSSSRYLIPKGSSSRAMCRVLVQFGSLLLLCKWICVSVGFISGGGHIFCV